MRVAAGSRPGDRELPPVTPRPSVRLVVPLLFASLPPLPPVLSPLPFSPGHGIISLKAHGGEGTTKEERLPYEADCIRPSRVLKPLAPRIPSLTLSLSLALNHPRRSFSLTPGGVAAHAPGVSFLSVLRLCAPFSPRIFSRPPVSSFLSLPLTRAIYFVFVPPVRVPFCPLARSLVRSAFALVRSSHRRVQTPRTILSAVPPFARSLAYRPSSSSSSSERLRIRIRSRESWSQDESQACTRRDAGSTRGRETLGDALLRVLS